MTDSRKDGEVQPQDTPKKNITGEIHGRPASNDALLAITEGLAACYRQRVEKRFHELVLDSYTKANLAEVVSKFYGWINNWMARRKGMNRGIILSGSVGNGKTTMLQAIGDYIGVLVGSANPYTSYPEREPKFYKAKDLVSIVAHGDEQRYEEAKRAGVLLIDDIGAEPVEIISYGMPIHPIQDILEYRHDNMLPTFFTTNMMVTELFGNNGRYPDKRLYDRAKEVFDIVTFRGGSYR